VGHVFEKNEVIRFGNTQLQIIESPGHSRGSVCFYCQKEHVLFSGDTLFRGSIGRTDLDGGSMMQIIQSLRQIAQLPDETVVYSGHGPQTTIGNELAHNPYMDR
jgi:glyoxylase-like metal-dependent hydrolase (beta-lactamase superfamily II)